MSVTSPIRTPSRVEAVAQDLRARKGRCVADIAWTLLSAWRERRRLLAWNRNLLRPPACAAVPDRAWRRNSALLATLGEPPSESTPGPVLNFLGVDPDPSRDLKSCSKPGPDARCEPPGAS